MTRLHIKNAFREPLQKRVVVPSLAIPRSGGRLAEGSARGM